MMSPQIADLLNATEALGCVHALLGSTVNRCWAGQIALRYPGDGCMYVMMMNKIDKFLLFFDNLFFYL
jgi:hypothetical protein